MNEKDRQELQKKPPQQNEPQPPNKRGQGLMHVILVFFLITFLMNFVFAMLSGNSVTEIAYSDFLRLVEAGQVEKVQVSDTEILVTLSEQADKDTVAEITGLNLNTTSVERGGIQSVVFSTGPMDDAGLTDMLYKNGVEFAQPVVRQSPILNFIISWIVPISLLYLMYYLIMRRMSNSMGGGMGGGGMFNVGKSKAKVYDMEKSTGVTFADVAGQDEAKESLTEIVDYLHNPGKYQKIGAQQPKGALLVGPPGTGKTLLAKAVAGEAKVPFYSLSGSEFVEMFVGVGASRVRDLFQEAEKAAPCIIFIDEIDAIGKSRDNQLGSNDEREQTLNQLLAQMDGFDSNKGIMVLAATNRPEVLDKALLRPGRFDRRIIVDKPDLPGREAILKVHAKKVTLGSDVDFHEIGLATSGATGADLANMVNEAALRAVRLGRDCVLQEDLMESVETVIAGKEKKDRVLNPKERELVAYHEVGHALVTSLQKNASPVQKITIVPRTMGALGYTMNAPEEERYLMTKEELLAQIRTLLGGRAAEEVAFGAMTTGASNDIERASELARRMVAQYGMSDAFGMMGIESTQNKYLDGRSVSNCAESTNARVDEEVRGIIETCHDEAVALLKENVAALESISAYLLEHETITGKTFMELLEKVQEEKAEA